MIPHQVTGVDPLVDTPRATYNRGNFIQELHVQEGTMDTPVDKTLLAI
jgi:hypothetical protein